ncbi:hypothetical protein FGSG_13045 [Fusarium graminearum PH-1]|uniref:hypothetical protein n=1 Tax=Gibberella zeae (strain ATCC MYA-4620 / CBS 123657 / FGSC 9075 / NRRL 31084 / PH-1) TaxID=229533 RepID=UPI00021F23EE|nr:hypothetical protein FGSG_13045 [Fusarium graminearum PH-1]ESU13220.1 hypothetical protein FGSG_13045 [Fusarium graminearum PH-1]|eukprot:XP_011326727.1 hypothetical protein FGSG_13045 [Fusarium graminearum PH-1]
MSQSKQPRPVNDDVVQPQCFELPMRNETLHVPGNRPLSIAILLKYVDHVAFKIDLEGQLKYIAARKTDKAGEDIPELLDKLQQTTTTYGELLLQASQIQALDQPNRRFLRNLLSVNRGILKDVDTSFLDEPNDDWVSITKQDRLDRLISQILATKIGRVLAQVIHSNQCQTPLRSKTEMIGEDKLDDYHEGVMKFAIFTVFSLILGVFTCAPAGIQSLNVVSTIGEVAVYVAFVIVFGWLSLGFLGGFERSLLTSLAFAGLMANLLRGND